MNSAQQLSKHLREVFFGGNWTSVNLKDTLENTDWQLATKKVDSLNTIAALVFHIGYYIDAVLKVLEGEALTAKDKYSFDLPSIQSQADWENLLNKTLSDAERFAALAEQLPEAKLQEIFVDEKYGNYYHNLLGIIEHTHYHLGQIVLIKKILSQT
jgi:uncharacterized damage-inducible protein DinB